MWPPPEGVHRVWCARCMACAAACDEMAGCGCARVPGEGQRGAMCGERKGEGGGQHEEALELPKGNTGKPPSCPATSETVPASRNRAKQVEQPAPATDRPDSTRLEANRFDPPFPQNGTSNSGPRGRKPIARTTQPCRLVKAPVCTGRLLATAAPRATRHNHTQTPHDPAEVEASCR